MKKIPILILFLSSFSHFIYGKPIILVSIPPQYEFVNRIAGNKVNIHILLKEGNSPHTYEVTPTDIMKIGKCQLWFTIGVDFEKALLPKVKSIYPDLKIVDTTKNVKYRNFTKEEHSEDEHHSEENLNLDPHIWLGFDQVKTVLYNMLQALETMLPEEKEFFRQNYKDYVNEIDESFSLLSNKLKELKGKTIYVYHPAFGYFLDSFGIKQKAFEIAGREPSQKQLVNLIKEMKKDNVKFLFVQKQFSKNSAIKIANATGATVVEIDPLAKDWLDNIRLLGEAISEVK